MGTYFVLSALLSPLRNERKCKHEGDFPRKWDLRSVLALTLVPGTCGTLVA